MNMDFRRLARALPDQKGGGNGTEPIALTDLPSNILEAFIPGYGLVSRYVAVTFGIDISIFVSLALVALAASKAWQYLFGMAQSAFRDSFMSSVYIDEHDDLFEMVMGWLAENQRTGSRRSLRAKTQKGSKADDAFDDSAGDALDANGMFDYTKWSARLPPRYEPHYGRNYLWHQGRLFFFMRTQKTGGQKVQLAWNGNVEDDLLQIDCIGRSSEPIKDLLRTIKIWSLNRLRNTTTIRHPTPKDRARFAGSWTKTSSRPSRPMETVILDTEQKSMIIRDMNEYLHPASPRWYATRGIPYRRGYLFHGPPGTGKTSLSFALAGIFGLEIHAISLQEPTLTEGDLLQLFNSLPRRCIVLLEDVDAAGLLRDSQSKDNDKPKAKKEAGGKTEDKKDETKAEKDKPKEEEYTLRHAVKDVGMHLKTIAAPQGGRGRNVNAAQGAGNANRAPGTGISLSGLLNAIDGVASAEGRVLIMTTNYPEKLDAALIRPGRVDRKAGFKLAMKEQISELFLRMYAASDAVPTIGPGQELKLNGQLSGRTKGLSNGKPVSKANGHANGHATEVEVEDQLSSLSPDDLEGLSLEFAGKIPDDTFTPAEIQNHLMRHKKEPRTAVALAAQWAEELTAEKTKEAEQRQQANEDGEEE